MRRTMMQMAMYRSAFAGPTEAITLGITSGSKTPPAPVPVQDGTMVSA